MIATTVRSNPQSLPSAGQPWPAANLGAHPPVSDGSLLARLAKHHKPHGRTEKCTIARLVETYSAFAPLLERHSLDQVCAAVSLIQKRFARERLRASKASKPWGAQQTAHMSWLHSNVSVAHLDEAGWNYQIKTNPTFKRIFGRFSLTVVRERLFEWLKVNRPAEFTRIWTPRSAARALTEGDRFSPSFAPVQGRRSRASPRDAPGARATGEEAEWLPSSGDEPASAAGDGPEPRSTDPPSSAADGCSDQLFSLADLGCAAAALCHIGESTPGEQVAPAHGPVQAPHCPPPIDCTGGASTPPTPVFIAFSRDEQAQARDAGGARRQCGEVLASLKLHELSGADQLALVSRVCAAFGM
jgi:hypothetical protein